MRLNRSPAVQNIDDLLERSKQRDKLREEGLHDKADSMNTELSKFVDSYIDDLTIVAACENYLKAKLLICGYVIHKIDTINDNLKELSIQHEEKGICQQASVSSVIIASVLRLNISPCSRRIAM